MDTSFQVVEICEKYIRIFVKLGGHFDNDNNRIKGWLSFLEVLIPR